MGRKLGMVKLPSNNIYSDAIMLCKSCHEKSIAFNSDLSFNIPQLNWIKICNKFNFQLYIERIKGWL